MPSLGLGTWRMGESPASQAAEVAAVRSAFDIGYRLIDTAEMYGDGGAEKVVGHALAESMRAGAVTRDDVFVVSKVYPHHASRAGVRQACERSLRRLALDHIDLYLLHWPGSIPLHETIDGFRDLQAAGRIRHWGVSNFDTDDLRALGAIGGGDGCAANQVEYSLAERGVAFDLLAYQQRHAMPLMAYSPLAQGEMTGQQALRDVGARHGASAARVALAWLVAQPGVIAIPKAARAEHLRDNFEALALRLDDDDLAALDRAFPAPTRKRALAMR